MTFESDSQQSTNNLWSVCFCVGEATAQVIGYVLHEKI